MTEKIEKILEKANILLRGHFLLTSGLHSDIYFEKFRIFQFPWYLEELVKTGKELIGRFDFDYVAGPEKGGFFIAYEVAKQFHKTAFYLEKKEDNFVIKRNFDKIVEGKKVIVADDVLTTGHSLSKVVNELKKNFSVQGVFVIIDRSEKEIDLGVPVISLYKREFRNYKPENCPLCEKNIPLIRPGGKRLS
jgi:orotate phosphoribosyltransferase